MVQARATKTAAADSSLAAGGDGGAPEGGGENESAVKIGAAVPSSDQPYFHDIDVEETPKREKLNSLISDPETHSLRDIATHKSSQQQSHLQETHSLRDIATLKSSQQQQQQSHPQQNHLPNSARNVCPDVALSFFDCHALTSSASSSASRHHGNAFNLNHHLPPSHLNRHPSSDESKILTPSLTSTPIGGAGFPSNVFQSSSSHPHAMIIASSCSSPFPPSSLAPIPPHLSSSHV